MRCYQKNDSKFVLRNWIELGPSIQFDLNAIQLKQQTNCIRIFVNSLYALKSKPCVVQNCQRVAHACSSEEVFPFRAFWMSANIISSSSWLGGSFKGLFWLLLVLALGWDLAEVQGVFNKKCFRRLPLHLPSIYNLKLRNIREIKRVGIFCTIFLKGFLYILNLCLKGFFPL